MSDYTELVKRLRILSDTDNISEFDEAADAIEDLISALTASNEVIAKSKPRWIPVTEQVSDGEVLAVNDLPGSYGFREYLVGHICVDFESDTGFMCNSEYIILPNITHWMPLPEPPKEAEQ